MPPLSRSRVFRRPLRVASSWMRLRCPIPAVLALAAVAMAGCTASESVSDGKIVDALHLKQTGHGYEMGGDPFCTVVQLLNDGDEVEQASDQRGDNVVIASPNGNVGVLARPPFAPDCAKRAKAALRRLDPGSD
jgi:hypothetical protein